MLMEILTMSALVIPAASRGHSSLDWLESWHSFSFGDYYEPSRTGFRDLRVINEDFVAPGQGFGMHGHRDMEIVTIVLSGALAHRDSLGNGEQLRYGDVQRMSAGTGIRHSEFNPSNDEAVHLYQIWLLPQSQDISPGYEQKRFDWSEISGDSLSGILCPVVSPLGKEGTLSIHQDVSIFVGQIKTGQRRQLESRLGRGAYLQVATGHLNVNGQALQAGDAMGWNHEADIEVNGEGLYIFFDLK
jgi:redox-sensitive bicupin YhaK (pirin superfamily)